MHNHTIILCDKCFVHNSYGRQKTAFNKWKQNITVYKLIRMHTGFTKETLNIVFKWVTILLLYIISNSLYVCRRILQFPSTSLFNSYIKLYLSLVADGHNHCC